MSIRTSTKMMKQTKSEYGLKKLPTKTKENKNILKDHQ